MTHSTRVPRGTAAEELDRLIGERDRLERERDRTITDNDQLRAELALAKARLRTIRHAATIAHAGGATVLRIDAVRTLLDAPPAEVLLGAAEVRG